MAGATCESWTGGHAVGSGLLNLTRSLLHLPLVRRIVVLRRGVVLRVVGVEGGGAEHGGGERGEQRGQEMRRDEWRAARAEHRRAGPYRRRFREGSEKVPGRREGLSRCSPSIGEPGRQAPGEPGGACMSWSGTPTSATGRHVSRGRAHAPFARRPRRVYAPIGMARGERPRGGSGGPATGGGG